MRVKEGLISTKLTSLRDVVAMVSEFPIRSSGRSFNFGFRKENGEFAHDVLLLETDGYCEIDQIEHCGRSYTVELSQESIEDVVAALPNHFPNKALPHPEIALRYYLEFDAYLAEDTWKFGIPDTRPGRRSPAEFWKKWMQ